MHVNTENWFVRFLRNFGRLFLSPILNGLFFGAGYILGSVLSRLAYAKVKEYVHIESSEGMKPI